MNSCCFVVAQHCRVISNFMLSLQQIYIYILCQLLKVALHNSFDQGERVLLTGILPLIYIELFVSVGLCAMAFVLWIGINYVSHNLALYCQQDHLIVVQPANYILYYWLSTGPFNSSPTSQLHIILSIKLSQQFILKLSTSH